MIGDTTIGETTRQTGSAVFWSVFARTGRFVLGLISSVIVVRGLGEYSYGVLSVVRTVLLFVVVIAGAGLGQSLLKFLPSLRVSDAGRGSRKLVRRVILIQVGAWILLFALGFVLSPRLESLFHIEGLGLLVWVGVCLAVFELFFTLFGNILNAHYDTKRLSIAHIASHLVFIGILVVLMRGEPTVMDVLLAGAAGNLVATIIIMGRVQTALAGASPEATGGGIDTGRLLRFSLPFTLIGVLNVIVWRQSETLFLAHFWGATETGFFDLAYRLPQTALEFIPGTVWPIILAGFSETYEKNQENLRMAIERYYKVLFLLSTPICLFGITLGGRIIPILFGEAMAPAAVPAQVFFAVFIVSFFGTPLSMSLYVMEKSHINLLIYIVLAIINVGLDLLLIPRYGIVGAMIPVALVIAVTPFIYKRVLNRFIDGVKIPYRFIGKCFLAASSILVLVPFLRFIVGIVELVAATLVAVVVVVLAVKKLKLIGEEESAMLSAIPFPAAERFLKFIRA